MHNGVYKTMRQMIDFYNARDSGGKGLEVNNQTLSPIRLRLTTDEITALLAFIKSLDDMVKELSPDHLLLSSDRKLKNRKIGGIY